MISDVVFHYRSIFVQQMLALAIANDAKVPGISNEQLKAERIERPVAGNACSIG
jgi:hypothetical protein